MIFKALNRLLSNSQFSKLDQSQNEAIVDLIALVMASDGVHEQTERAEVERALTQIDWKDHSSAALYFENALRAAPGTLADEASLGAKLDAIAGALDETWIQEEAYYMAARTAAVDSDLAPEEQVLLRELVARFDISKDRMRTLTASIMEKFDI